MHDPFDLKISEPRNLNDTTNSAGPYCWPTGSSAVAPGGHVQLPSSMRPAPSRMRLRPPYYPRAIACGVFLAETRKIGIERGAAAQLSNPRCPSGARFESKVSTCDSPAYYPPRPADARRAARCLGGWGLWSSSYQLAMRVADLHGSAL